MKIYKIIISLLFVCTLLLGGILTLTSDTKTVSETENRFLQTEPQLSWTGLIDGSYFKKYDDFFRDQFWGREIAIIASSNINLELGKKKFKNVVLGKDGYLLEFQPFYSDRNETNLKSNVSPLISNLKQLNDFSLQHGVKFIFTGIPTQSYYNYSKYYNYFNDNRNYNREVENYVFSNLNESNVPYINMGTVFNLYEDQVYYKTDHHYNEKGSYLTYTEIINTLISQGVPIRPPYTWEELNYTPVMKPFRGSWNSNLNWQFKSNEKIYVPSINMPKYTYLADYEKKDSVFHDNHKSYAAYNTYMGGDKAEQIISTNRPELPNILIFGDSYTNAIEPLISMHFNETRILDLRCYKDMNLYDYIEKNKPNVVIYVSSSDSYDKNSCDFNTNNDFIGQYKQLKNKIK